MTSSPLLPISELCQSSTKEHSSVDKINKMMTDEISNIQKAEKESILKKIDVETKTLVGKQEEIQAEIQKRVTEVQTLKENNLVLAGAISSLKKIREQF